MTKRVCGCFTLGLLAVIAVGGTSCKMLTPLIFVGEHKQKVTAEFDKLDNRKVAVLVWTDAATLFDYPHARFELATYIADKLQAEMSQRNLGTELVDPRDVEDFIQRNPDAQVDPLAVGKKFKTDYVIYLEILTFQVRDPDEPQFLRGKIEASVVVSDVRADPDQLRRYELTTVNCVHPEGAPILMTRTNSALIREAVYRKFAEQVARKFYEHQIDL